MTIPDLSYIRKVYPVGLSVVLAIPPFTVMQNLSEIHYACCIM